MNTKTTLLENDLKESKKYTKEIMNRIAEELDNNGYEYIRNNSNTEFVIDGHDKTKDIKDIVYNLGIDRKIIDDLLTKDILHDKVFIRLTSN